MTVSLFWHFERRPVYFGFHLDFRSLGVSVPREIMLGTPLRFHLVTLYDARSFLISHLTVILIQIWYP